MLMADNRLKSSRSGTRYRPGWRFRRDAVEDIRRELETCDRPVIHVCAGGSNIGDVKVDLHHPGAQVRADGRRLPFRNVPTILTDPPWPIPVDERWRFLQSAMDALRPGGVLLLYSPWMPAFDAGDNPEAELENILIYPQTTGLPHNIVALERWRKVAA